MNAYEKLDKDDLLLLLVRRDQHVEALLDRDEAKEDLANERRKHEATRRRLEVADKLVDRLRGRIKEMESLPAYHQLLDYLCTELGVAGSPTFASAVADIKKRLAGR